MYRPHASSEDLLAFALEGQPLRPVVQQHLDRCPTCQRQVGRYQKTASLIPRLYRSRCPSATALSYYCLPGALTDNEHQQIAEHLVRCPLCMHELVETREFLHVS